MKTKIILTALLSTLLINAKTSADVSTLKGTVDVGYSSESHRRGSIVSQDALQASIGVNTAVNGVDVFGDVYSSQSIDEGSDQLDGTIGVGFDCPLSDKLDVYAGVYNSSIDSVGSTLEVFLAAVYEAQLSPSVYIYRDVDDELYTVEGQLSYTLDVNAYSVQLAAALGNTDVTETTDTVYTAASVKVERGLTEATDVYVTAAASDSDDRDVEVVTKVGLTVRF